MSQAAITKPFKDMPMWSAQIRGFAFLIPLSITLFMGCSRSRGPSESQLNQKTAGSTSVQTSPSESWDEKRGSFIS